MRREQDLAGREGDFDLGGAWQELAAAAGERPWLLRLLAEQGAALATRYALWKQRLRTNRGHVALRLGMGLAGAALLLALAAGPAQALGPALAGTITVAAGASGNNPSDGCSLVEAINNANNDNQSGSVECAAGSGADTITLPAGATLSYTSSFGTDAALPDITTAITIEGNGSTIQRASGSAAFRLLNVWGTNASLTLNSATISGGSAGTGGGIYAVSASLVVTNSTLSANSSDSHLVGGGGIRAWHGSLEVRDSTLSGNSALFNGGGIEADHATVTVANSTLSGNSVSGEHGVSPYRGFGGGIAANTCMLVVTGSAISDNEGWYGGGIGAVSGTATVANSTLAGNSALQFGGGVQAINATLAVTNSTLSGNSAMYGGGIEARLGATVTVTNSKLSGNSAGDDGGGIEARHNATVTVANSTLSGNTAGGRGGGVNADRTSTVTVTNSTLSGNGAAQGGGVISWLRYASVVLERSLVTGNNASVGSEVAIGGDATITAGNHNLLGHDEETNAQAFSGFTPGATDIAATSDGGGTPATLAGILNTTLAANGSPVKAGALPGEVVRTLALIAGSPAVDAAPDDAECPDADQRGVGRPQGSACDIGAYELPQTRILVTKQTLPSDDPTVFTFRLRGPAGRTFDMVDNSVKDTGLLPEGVYTLNEDAAAGWDGYATCSDGSPLNAISLQKDETVTCRFTNVKRGSIIVNKVTQPAGAAQVFAMTLTNRQSGLRRSFSLAGGQTYSSGLVEAGPAPFDGSVYGPGYKLVESVPGGWRKVGIKCDNGSLAGAIVVPPGGTVTCTVTNQNTPPTDVKLAPASVAENKAVGTLVGTLSAVDAVAGDTYVYSFVNDGTTAAAGNSAFQIAGSQLKTAKKLDYETKKSYPIKVKVVDSAGQAKVKALTVTVIDGPD